MRSLFPFMGLFRMGSIQFAMLLLLRFQAFLISCVTFISLGEAAKPVYEADRHAKKELKKQVRGIRPIEREVEQQENEEATITRKYCLAVRSALTDDGHPPLSAPGVKLYERLSLIVVSLERVAQKGALPSPLDTLHRLLAKGIAATEPWWSEVQVGYALIHRAAHI